MNAIVAPNAQIAARNSRSAGISRQIAVTAPKPMIPTGVARVAVQRADPRRDLAVDGERVAQPREAEHRRLGGADEDHERRDRDQVLRRLAQPRLLEGVGDAQQRRLDPLASPVCGSTEEATSAIPR